jgi:hypothetical protein
MMNPAYNRRWNHRFNSESIPPVCIDTKSTGKTVPYYSYLKENLSI